MRDAGHQTGLCFAALTFEFRRNVPYLQRRGGIDNGAIARTPAQIAGKCRINVGWRQTIAIAPGGKQRHDKSRRAEPAL